jgi:hypothetical protein
MTLRVRVGAGAGVEQLDGGDRGAEGFGRDEWAEGHASFCNTAIGPRRVR